MKKVCIYSGSFNPIHCGHIALARYVVREKLADEVWVVVSPQNPLKSASALIQDDLRLKMAQIAFRGDLQIMVSDVELHLPKPSYTIDTLEFLQKNHSDCEFSLLIGMDSLNSFHRWKRYQDTLRKFRLLVYPRRGEEPDISNLIEFKDKIQFIEAPNIEISSTEIRQMIAQDQSITGFVEPKVEEFILKNKLYRVE